MSEGLWGQGYVERGLGDRFGADAPAAAGTDAARDTSDDSDEIQTRS
jgi:hypothetical protein